MRDATLTPRQIAIALLAILILLLPQVLLVSGFDGPMIKLVTSDRGFIVYAIVLALLVIALTKYLPSKLRSDLEIQKKQVFALKNNYIVYYFWGAIAAVFVIVIVLGSLR
jgi:Ca2+/Na+ antiporter